MRGLRLAGPRTSVPGKLQPFHGTHSRLQSRGQTSGQRAPQLQFTPAKPQTLGEGPWVPNADLGLGRSPGTPGSSG